MQNRVSTAAVIVSVLVLAACSGEGDSTAPNTGLKPAGETAAEDAAAKASPVGEMVEIDSNTRFTVMGFKANTSDSLGPWVDVSLRGEASNDTGAMPFEIAILCASSTETGGWQVGSTVSPGQEIPPGSYLEGFISLLLPEDGRFGELIKKCDEPALVKATSQEKTIWFAIPSDVVAQMNTAADDYNSTLAP